MKARAPKIKPGSLLPGTKYIVNRLIGAGGMGVVYEVTKPPAITGVLKLMGLDIADDVALQRRFFDEVRILAQLDHPNIVRVFDYDTLEDGTPFYVMELLHGGTLRDAIASVGQVPPRAAFELTRQLCSALDCAHTHDVQVVHRDIKPDNIFLHTPRHGEPLVKLIDFGVSAFSDRTEDGMFAGTLSYAAPEQIQGLPSTPAADIYAVGCVLYEMLSGVGPADEVVYGDGPSSAALAYLTHVPSSLAELAPWVPPSIVSLVEAALAKDPARRPASAREFAERLADLEDASADPRGPRPIVAPPKAGARGAALRTLTVDFGRARAARPVADVAAHGDRGAPTAVGLGPTPRTADTFSSQHSDARSAPRSSPTRPVVAAAAVACLLAGGVALFSSARRTGPLGGSAAAGAAERASSAAPMVAAPAPPPFAPPGAAGEADASATPLPAPPSSAPLSRAGRPPAPRNPISQPRAAASGSLAPAGRAPSPPASVEVRRPAPADDLIRTGP